MDERFKKIRKSGMDQNLKLVLQKMQYYTQLKPGHVPNLTSGTFDNKNTISGFIWRNIYGVLYGEGRKKTMDDINNLQNQLSMLVDGIDDKFTCELIIENIIEMNQSLNILKMSYSDSPTTISDIQIQIFNFEVIKNCINDKIEKYHNNDQAHDNSSNPIHIDTINTLEIPTPADVHPKSYPMSAHKHKIIDKLIDLSSDSNEDFDINEFFTTDTTSDTL